MDGLSADVFQERLEELKRAAPEVFADGRIDASQLERYFGAGALAADAEGERYRIEWSGKKAVFNEIAKRTSCTLTLDTERSSKDWQDSQNIFIEGENLEALRALQKAYHGQVKMIYIDPPYNTGNDFVYHDDFSQSEEEYCEGTCDAEGNLQRAYKKNSKDSGRYHSDWLSMMYPRLYLARNLLRDDGVIFVSIDDNEVHNLRMIMNEIFGEENFVAAFKWNKTSKAPTLSSVVRNKYEYVVLYKRKVLEALRGPDSYNTSAPLFNGGNAPRTVVFPVGSVDCKFEDGTYRAGDYGEGAKSVRLESDLLVRDGKNASEVVLTARFKWTQQTVNNRFAAGQRFMFRKPTFTTMYYYLNDTEQVTGAFIAPSDIINSDECGVERNDEGHVELKQLFDGVSVFDYVKPVSLMRYLIQSCIDTKAIVLDFFSGSGTTAHAVMAQNAEDGGNRKYICVQLPEETPEESEARKAGYTKISDIAIERIKRAATKVRKEHPEWQGDAGMRVYRITDSHFPQWNARSFESDEELQTAIIEYAKKSPAGSPDDRATEVLLKLGYPPTTPIERKDGWLLAAGSVALVLDDAFSAAQLTAVLEAKPRIVVVLEGVFKSDSDKINFGLRCKEADTVFQTV